MSYEYEPITTYFSPTIWSEDIKGQFGLVSSHDWKSFKESIEELSAKCSKGECIKVIYLARHGHGEHNIIHEKYATWEQAKKVHTPHDASLAPSGIAEALEEASALKREVCKGMPVPEKFFVSSLKRTGETCGLEWGWLFGSGDTAETGKVGWVEGEDRGCGIAATVIENLRESISGGQHNSRSDKTYLRTLFPTFIFPDEMSERDELWVPETWEKEDEVKMCKRLERGLGEVVERSGGCTYISKYHIP